MPSSWQSLETEKKKVLSQLGHIESLNEKHEEKESDIYPIYNAEPLESKREGYL